MWRQTFVQKYTYYDKSTLFISIFVKSGDSKAFVVTFATIVATEIIWLDTAALIVIINEIFLHFQFFLGSVQPHGHGIIGFLGGRALGLIHLVAVGEVSSRKVSRNLSHPPLRCSARSCRHCRSTLRRSGSNASLLCYINVTSCF